VAERSQTGRDPAAAIEDVDLVVGARQAAELEVHAGVEIADPKRTIAELKELRELTGDQNGAQRVAFTPVWERARKWLR
jgi:hypothetical protein